MQPAQASESACRSGGRRFRQPAQRSALDERHDDHEEIRAALHAGDQATARAAMERHIVGTVAVIHAESAATERWP
jgi:DNA-binding GntR family transcriptional regulator